MLFSLLSATAGFAAGTLELVSGATPDNLSATPSGQSQLSSLSADGRYVVFTSEALNVISGQTDANRGKDVFLRDQVAGTTVLVSHADGATSSAGNAASSGGQISADGRYVLFGSTATNLVTGQVDGPNSFDLFLYDRVIGTTALVSHSSASPRQTGNDRADRFSSSVLSADGRWVVFASWATNLVSGQTDGNGSSDVFLYNRVAGTTTLVSRSAGSATKTGNNESSSAGPFSISADGSYILFLSGAVDLVPGGTTSFTSRAEQLFLFNRLAGTATLVSHSLSSATEGVSVKDASISADGNFIAFFSGASLVPETPPSLGGDYLYLYNRPLKTVVRVTRTANYDTASPRLSADGRFLAFYSGVDDLGSGQTGGERMNDVFLYDRVALTTTLVSRSLTSDFQTSISSLTSLSISADGRFIAYLSCFANLVPGQVDLSAPDPTLDVFLFNRTSGTNRLVSHAAGSSTEAAGGADDSLAISANGHSVGFSSQASDIVDGKRDFNRSSDVLLYNSGLDDSEIVSLREGQPSITGAYSRARAISDDGRYTLFSSDAPNLVAGQRDVNDHDTTRRRDQFDAFLYDRVSRIKTLVSHSPASPATTGNGPSEALALSPDGRWSVFFSQATDLVSGQNDDNGGADIFLFDRSTGAVTLVSHRAGAPSTTGHGQGSEAHVSADGRFVAFESTADDLVPGQIAIDSRVNVFLYDRVSSAIQLVSHAAGSATSPPPMGPSRRHEP